MIKRSTYIPRGKEAGYAQSYLRGILEDARMTTLQRVDGVERDELHWQYDKGWYTIGALLSHIISCEHVFRIEFVEGRKMTTEENDEYEPGLEMGRFVPSLITNNTIDDYIFKMQDAHTLLLEKIDNLSDEDLFEKRDGYDPVTGCNLAWVLYHLAEDEVHHRGQISILRKLYSEYKLKNKNN